MDKGRIDEGCMRSFLHFPMEGGFVWYCLCFSGQQTATVIWTGLSGELRQAGREGEGSLSFGGATVPPHHRRTLLACSSIKHTSQVTKHARSQHSHTHTHIYLHVQVTCMPAHTHSHSHARTARQGGANRLCSTRGNHVVHSPYQQGASIYTAM